MKENPAGCGGGAVEGRQDSQPAPSPQPIPFIRRRLAAAIGRGDDQTAERLRAQLDHLLNGPQP